MKNLKIVFAIVFAMVLSVTMKAQQSGSTSNYSDFSRKGFLLSIGLGGGSIQQKISYDEVQSTPEKALSSVADITLGFGFTEQFTGFLTLKENRYTIEDEIDKMNTSFQFTGVGGSYFLKPTAKSPFITGGVGIASQVVDPEENLTINGVGCFLGIGYSLNKNMSLKLEAIWGKPSIEVFDEQLSINTTSIGLSANYTF